MSDTPAPPGTLTHPELLAIYCNNHIASSTGGIELVARMVGIHRGGQYEDRLQQLLEELREEKVALSGIMKSLGIPVRQYKQLALWAGEKVSRLLPNGHLLSRSPLSDVIEFEFLASAIRGKRSGFETLRIAAEIDRRIDAALLDGLIAQANRQHDWVTEVRRELAADVFGGDPAAAGRADDGSGGAADDA